MESNFHIRLFSEKMEYYEIHIFVPTLRKTLMRVQYFTKGMYMTEEELSRGLDSSLDQCVIPYTLKICNYTRQK